MYEMIISHRFKEGDLILHEEVQFLNKSLNSKISNCTTIDHSGYYLRILRKGANFLKEFHVHGWMQNPQKGRCWRSLPEDQDH